VLGVLPALRPEAASDVAGDDADLVLRHLEDHARQRVPHAVGVLDVRVERVAVLGRIVAAESAPGLQVLRVHPGDDVAAPDHPVGPGAGEVRGHAVARLEDVRDIVRALVPDRRAAGPGVRRRGHRRQRLVIDQDQLGRVPGLGRRLGDHEGDRIAHVSNAIPNEARVGRCPHRRAVGSLPPERHPGRAGTIARQIDAGEDRDDTRGARGRSRVDGPDPRVCVR
jgi:hypothetical protein